MGSELIQRNVPTDTYELEIAVMYAGPKTIVGGSKSVSWA